MFMCLCLCVNVFEVCFSIGFQWMSLLISNVGLSIKHRCCQWMNCGFD